MEEIKIIIEERITNKLILNFRGWVHVSLNSTFLYCRVNNDAYGCVEYFDKNIWEKIRCNTLDDDIIVKELKNSIIEKINNQLFK